MMHKAWCSMEDVPYCFLRSSIKFQGHMGQKNLPILTRIERFRTVTSVWIHRWIWNALLFFEVIHQISRSHGLKIDDFGSNLSKITRPVADIKSLRFALFMYFQSSKIIKNCDFFGHFLIRFLLWKHETWFIGIPVVCKVYPHPQPPPQLHPPVELVRPSGLLLFNNIQFVSYIIYEIYNSHTEVIGATSQNGWIRQKKLWGQIECLGFEFQALIFLEDLVGHLRWRH